MERYFGPKGLLAAKISGFDFRASQLQMAEAVAESLALRKPLIVEAGTGTGKTWAYLIPAILSGLRVVVSTGTKTLQDQILDHDIPFLKRLLRPALKAVCMKGRGNYLCRRRFRDFAYQPTLYSREEAKLFKRFQTWAKRTPTGERADISWLPDRFLTWNEVCSSTEHCLGQACEDHGRCFVTQLRAEASRADLLVVNHHLFFADLSLRRNGGGEILPNYDAVIFDEAHQIEDTAGPTFGIELSDLKIFDFARDLMKEGKRGGKTPAAQAMMRIAQQLEVLGRLLSKDLGHGRAKTGRFTLDHQKVGPGFTDTCEKIVHAAGEISSIITPGSDNPPAWEPLYRRGLEIGHCARSIMEGNDPSLVYWYELTPKATFLHGTPVEVGPLIHDHLFGRVPSVVLTSATLSVAGSFDYVRNTLGAPSDCTELTLPSPFDYGHQAGLFIPARFPAPLDPDFIPSLASQVIEILGKTRGRALLLFTSYRNMTAVHDLIKGKLPYPILMQGQKAKRALLAEFKENVSSVLLATSSFWQGIDVPGETLSCLLIDKLPFEAPDDPLIAARMETFTERGKSPFFHYQIPRAIIGLRQGVGRLIRSQDDRGIIGIFDIRLTTKGYGRLFLDSLPRCRIISHPDEIDGFFAKE